MTKPRKPKPTRLQSARKWLAAAQRKYDNAERALVAAALIGCTRRDPSMNNQSEAGSSGRRVDVSGEVADLRWARNELTDAEAGMRAAKRKGAK